MKSNIVTVQFPWHGDTQDLTETYDSSAMRERAPVVKARHEPKRIAGMTWKARTNTWKSSNIVFNVNETSAHSYDWWKFVAVIKGKVVFNWYSYSVSTSKHQRKVSTLMRELGIEIDRTVCIRESLSTVDTLKELNALEKAEKIRVAADLEDKRVKRNEKARLRRMTTKLENYLENECAFRDYTIEPKRRFGHVNDPSTIHQQVDAKTMERDVENALHSFGRDGFGSIVFYV